MTSSQLSPRAPAPQIELERPQDAAAIERLHDRAFGPGRFTKVSERVREIADFAPELSFCAWEGERLLGAVRQWRVRVGDAPIVFLGPLAVDVEARSAGLGRLLTARACAAAAAAGEGGVLLVGDEAFFAEVGFTARPISGCRGRSTSGGCCCAGWSTGPPSRAPCGRSDTRA
jgi:predicted N-acetyltransferase YhbS